jgi:hypothetical protein
MLQGLIGGLTSIPAIYGSLSFYRHALAFTGSMLFLGIYKSVDLSPEVTVTREAVDTDSVAAVRSHT